MKSKFASLVLLLPLLASAAEAGRQQDSKPLTLDEAIKTALANHPRLRTIQHQIEEAVARVEQARSTYFPQLDAGGLAKQGLSGSANLFGLHGLSSSPFPDDLAVSINAYQDVFDFGRTKHETAARRFEIDYLRNMARAEESKVSLEVRRAYYNALKAEKSTEVARQSVRERRLTLRQADVFYRAQLRSKVDVSLSQVELSRAELELVEAQNKLAHALFALNNAMGLEDQQASYRLQEPQISVEDPDPLEGLLALSMEERPELRAIEARIDAADRWVERAKSERRPKLMAAFSTGVPRFAEYTLGKFLFGGFAFKLPLFTGRRLEARIEEASRRLEETRSTKSEQIRNIRLEVSTAYHDLTTSIEAVTAHQRIVTQAEEALRLARLRYEVEIADFVELVTAETAHITAQSDYSRALYDYKIRRSELLYAVGRDF